MREFLYFLINTGHPKPNIPYEKCENFKRAQDQIDYERRGYLPSHRSLLLLLCMIGICGWMGGWPGAALTALVVIALGSSSLMVREYLTASNALAEDRRRLRK